MSREKSSCGGTLIPKSACGDSLAVSAAGGGRSVPYPGIVETVQFKAICGSSGVCFGSLSCIKQIATHCLNPAHASIDSGDPPTPENKSMRNYPIFYSAFCQTAMKELFADTKKKLAARTPDANECAELLHSEVSRFCSVFGEGETNATPAAAYSRFLEPSEYTEARVFEDQAREGGAVFGEEEPRYSTWKLRGVPFESDFTKTDVTSEDANVIVLALNISRGIVPPVFTGREGARQPPYATEAKVTLKVKTSKFDAEMFKAPNQIDYAKLFSEFVGINDPTNVMVIRADKDVTVKIDTSNGTLPPTEVTIRPEISGTIKSCELSFGDGDEGRVNIKLINVYTNASQFYADKDANCGCFAPFEVTTGEKPSIKVPTSLKIRNTPNTISAKSPTLCRYGWNEIPSPTRFADDYERFGFGEFQILLYKNYAKFGCSIGEDLTKLFKLPRGSPQDEIGALEITGFTSPAFFLADFCACHLPQLMYSSYYSFLNNAGNTEPKTECLFPGCAASNFPSLESVRNDIDSKATCKKLPCTPSFRYSPSTLLFTAPAVGDDKCTKKNTSPPSFRYADTVTAIISMALTLAVTVIAVVLIVYYMRR